MRACPSAMDRKSSGKCGQPHCGQKYPEELRHQCTKSAHLAARPPAFLDVYKRQVFGVVFALVFCAVFYRIMSVKVSVKEKAV